MFYERLGVNGTARVVKTEYDCLADRFKALTVGRVKQNLASIIVENEKKTESEFAQVKSALETAVDDATDFIRHGQGYMRFIYNSSNELVEIVSLDDPDITQAQSVWRWNNGGFGHSSTGYNGPYTLAITQNGAIVADFITAGTLNSNVIKAGILQDALGKNSWNLDTGDLTITDGMLTATYINGPIFYRSDYDPEPLAGNNADVLNLRNILNRGAPFSQEELDRYDFYNDGTLSYRDLALLREMIYANKDRVASRVAVIDPREAKVIRAWDTDLRDTPKHLTEQTASGYTVSLTSYGTGVEEEVKSQLGYNYLFSQEKGINRFYLDNNFGLRFWDYNGNLTGHYPVNGAPPMTWDSENIITNAGQFDLTGCTGTVANVGVNLNNDTLNRIISISGRVRINNFSKTSGNPGVILKGYAYPTDDVKVIYSAGIVCNQSGIIPSECLYITLSTAGQLAIRCTETLQNISGTAVTMLIHQTFIKY